jgi:RimJ/RimL family protein N-acetyltransferase
MFAFGRIQLRPFEMDDLTQFQRWRNDTTVMLYSRGHPFMFENRLQLEEYTEKRLKDKEKVVLAIELQEDGRFIGITKYTQGEWGGVRSTSIGTLIGEKDCWDKGYGKEITLALCEILFMWKNYERLEAWSVEYNTRAHRVLEYCGFKKEGELRKSTYLNGMYWSWYVFGCLTDEYLAIREEILQATLKNAYNEYCEFARDLNRF